MARRKKRVVKYCKEHGPFVGLSWNGHRRWCQAPEVSRREYTTHVRPLARPSTTAPTRKPAADPPRPTTPVAPVIPHADQALTAVRNAISGYDETILELTKKLEEAKKDRAKLIASLKSLVK